MLTHQLPLQAAALLHFWFQTAQPFALWFHKSPQTDAYVKNHYSQLLQDAQNNGLSDWSSTPRGRLALIVLLDQLPRMMARDTPEAFAGDAKAVELCLEGLARKDDQALEPLEKAFFYIVLMHAEDLQLQNKAVQLFDSLRKNPQPSVEHTKQIAEQQTMLDNFYDYALRHRSVIAQYGRFPHRNQILGRTSSQAELLYLQQPAAGF